MSASILPQNSMQPLGPKNPAGMVACAAQVQGETDSAPPTLPSTKRPERNMPAGPTMGFWMASGESNVQ